MKTYWLFFVVFTLAEVIFSALYWSVFKQADVFLFAGFVIYLSGMASGIIGYRLAKYEKLKRELIESIP
jgi:hypothetical protein